MKFRIRVTSFLVALVCLLSCFSVFPAFAEPTAQSDGEGGNYKRKIVSVVYDNSGSMTPPSNTGPATTENRDGFARYALQMLMSMLSSEDTLVITPMNVRSGVSASFTDFVEVDLSDGNRNQQIVDAMSKLPIAVSGMGTPGSSIRLAIEQLEARGLYTQDELWKADENTEHWLVVVTDGTTFSDDDRVGYTNADGLMKHYTANFPTLKTIYLGIGSGAASSIPQSPTYFPKEANTSSTIVTALREISNLLTGRYSLDSKYYTVSGSTVTINLPSEYSFKSLAVIAQNCGATLQSATYNGTRVTLTNPCVIDNGNLTDSVMKNGYSATLEGNPYFSGGTLTLNFSAAVAKENLSILAEPALNIEMYLQRQSGSNWVDTDMQYINSHLSGGDKIRVGYKVYDYFNNSEVDIDRMFGDKVESVSYSGHTYGVGDPIPLVVGSNEIVVSVSVMNGAYTLYDSLKCIIESNPTAYRVDVSGKSTDAATGKSQATFTVYVNGSKVTDWSKYPGYTQSVEVTNAYGATTSAATLTKGSDGSFTAVHTAKTDEYGKFTMTFTVASDQNMKRIATYEYELKPSNVELVKKNFPDTFSGANATLTFTVKTDGTELSKALLDRYGVTASAKITDPNGKSSTVNATVGSDGKLSIPVSSASGVFGDYKVDITVKSGIFADQKISHTVSCPPSSGSGTTVTLVKGNCANEFDGSKNAQLEFSMKANGAALNKEQVEKFYDLTVKVESPDGVANAVTPTVSADGKILVTAAAESGKFGDYVVTVTATLKGNTSEKYEATHSVTYEAAALELEQGSAVDKFDNDGKTQLEYVVKVDGKPLTKQELDQYTLACKLTDPNGNTVDVTPTVGSDGKITLSPEATKGLYGEYTFVFTVTSKVDESITATANVTLLFELAPIEIKQEHEALITSPSLSAQLTYKIYMEGKQMMLNDLSNFSWALKVVDPKGNEMPLALQVGANGALTATVTVPDGDYGGYIAQFVLTLPDGSEMEAEPHTVHYHPASVEIKGEQKGELGNGVTQIGFEHTVSINGVTLTAEELNRYDWSLEALAPGGTNADMDINIDDNGLITSSLDVTATGFGKYDVKLTVSLCDDLIEEQSFELKFYPVSMTVSTADGNGMSVTQHQLTYNDKAIKFELTADGSPFIFDNGLTTHKVLVDGQDVTAYTTIEGNVLSYVPHADHFGGGDEIAVGERTVTITVDCEDIPTLTTNATAKFSVTPTVYGIVTLDVGNKTVDRFYLGQVDAALYFQVIRDGIPLPLEELKSEWESGKIKLSDTTGTFGWQFWLPVGSEATVEELDGQPVIAFRVTQDWIKPFDSYAAMLIFNGDKPITVSYRDVSGTDSINFTPSGAWSYIWRILVILFIIHTILYCIGFFKCKALPSGYFVYVPLGGDSSREDVDVYGRVNIGYKEILLWHLLRFVPNKHGYLFYNQPAKPIPATSWRLGFDEEGNSGLFFKNPDGVYPISTLWPSPFKNKLDQFTTDLMTWDGKGSSPEILEVPAREIRGTLGKKGAARPVENDVWCSAGEMYGEYEVVRGHEKLVSVFMFVTKV